MDKKIIVLLIILIFSTSVVWAENNTTENIEIEDTTSYIIANSISDNGILFSDGFTGFCIDSSKAKVDVNDEFSLDSFSSNNLQNTIKLTIIECYKQQKQDQIGEIISQIVNKNYDSSNEVIKAVLNSHKSIGDNAVVSINDTTEATFNFELLSSANENTSDCIAYDVSFKTTAGEDILAASDNETDNITDSNSTTISEIDNNTENETNEIENETNNTAENKTTNTTANKTLVNETNTTIITKTNTTIVNETNTTIINKHNINNTTVETPQNDTLTDTIMRTVGNPITILIIALAAVAIAVAAIRRKG